MGNEFSCIQWLQYVAPIWCCMKWLQMQLGDEFRWTQLMAPKMAPKQVCAKQWLQTAAVNSVVSNIPLKGDIVIWCREWLQTHIVEFPCMCKKDICGSPLLYRLATTRPHPLTSGLRECEKFKRYSCKHSVVMNSGVSRRVRLAL